MLAITPRFAENPDQLYRFSSTHGGMACEACLGSPHAEWPARSNSIDNITATQIQGHTGEISECGSCHTGDLTPGLNGPHGLHSVNCPIWGGVAHGSIYKQDKAACQACHGLDLKGTVLSRAKADRILRLSLQMKGGMTQIAKDTPVNCYTCHTAIP